MDKNFNTNTTVADYLHAYYQQKRTVKLNELVGAIQTRIANKLKHRLNNPNYILAFISGCTKKCVIYPEYYRKCRQNFYGIGLPEREYKKFRDHKDILRDNIPTQQNNNERNLFCGEAIIGKGYGCIRSMVSSGYGCFVIRELAKGESGQQVLHTLVKDISDIAKDFHQDNYCIILSDKAIEYSYDSTTQSYLPKTEFANLLQYFCYLYRVERQADAEYGALFPYTNSKWAILLPKDGDRLTIPSMFVKEFTEDRQEETLADTLAKTYIGYMAAEYKDEKNNKKVAYIAFFNRNTPPSYLDMGKGKGRITFGCSKTDYADFILIKAIAIKHKIDKILCGYPTKNQIAFERTGAFDTPNNAVLLTRTNTSFNS